MHEKPPTRAATSRPRSLGLTENTAETRRTKGKVKGPGPLLVTCELKQSLPLFAGESIQIPQIPNFKAQRQPNSTHILKRYRLYSNLLRGLLLLNYADNILSIFQTPKTHTSQNHTTLT